MSRHQFPLRIAIYDTSFNLSIKYRKNQYILIILKTPANVPSFQPFDNHKFITQRGFILALPKVRAARNPHKTTNNINLKPIWFELKKRTPLNSVRYLNKQKWSSLSQTIKSRITFSTMKMPPSTESLCQVSRCLFSFYTPISNKSAPQSLGRRKDVQPPCKIRVFWWY